MASIRPPEYPFADGPGNIIRASHIRQLYDALGEDPLAASQTNADRWSTGTIWLRCDQPAGSRKVAHGTCVFGQSTGDNIGQADIGLEWANTTDPIETLRLFCSADLVAGSRFTVLGRRVG